MALEKIFFQKVLTIFRSVIPSSSRWHQCQAELISSESEKVSSSDETFLTPDGFVMKQLFESPIRILPQSVKFRTQYIEYIEMTIIQQLLNCAFLVDFVFLSFDNILQRLSHRTANMISQKKFPSFSARDKLFNGEFDSGSERTLAAWIRHASRTGFSL